LAVVVVSVVVVEAPNPNVTFVVVESEDFFSSEVLLEPNKLTPPPLAASVVVLDLSPDLSVSFELEDAAKPHGLLEAELAESSFFDDVEAPNALTLNALDDASPFVLFLSASVLAVVVVELEAPPQLKVG